MLGCALLNVLPSPTYKIQLFALLGDSLHSGIEVRSIAPLQSPASVPSLLRVAVHSLPFGAGLFLGCPVFLGSCHLLVFLQTCPTSNFEGGFFVLPLLAFQHLEKLYCCKVGLCRQQRMACLLQCRGVPRSVGLTVSIWAWELFLLTCLHFDFHADCVCCCADLLNGLVAARWMKWWI